MVYVRMYLYLSMSSVNIYFVTTQIVAVAILAPATTARVSISVSGKATSVVPSRDRSSPLFPKMLLPCV